MIPDVVLFSQNRGQTIEHETRSLQDEVNDKLRFQEIPITRWALMEVLDEVQIENRIKAFFSRPIVAISFSVSVIFLGGLFLNAVATIMFLAGVVLLVGGMIATDVAIFKAADGTLTRASNTYTDIAADARMARRRLLENAEQSIHLRFSDRRG